MLSATTYTVIKKYTVKTIFRELTRCKHMVMEFYGKDDSLINYLAIQEDISEKIALVI